MAGCSALTSIKSAFAFPSGPFKKFRPLINYRGKRMLAMTQKATLIAHGGAGDEAAAALRQMA